MPDASLPPDWQAQMVEMIRGAAPLRADWFTGGPVCTPEQQIGIYARQYRLRLYEALIEEIPGSHALLRADPELAAEPLLRRYLAEHPSGSWTLDRVADALPGWLAEQAVPESLVEMAWLDRAVQQGFSAAEGRSLQPEVLAHMPSLTLQPHVTLLRTRHNVHSLRSAALTGQALPALRAGDFPLVVFRRGLKMRHWVMPLPAWGILEGIASGGSVAEAVERVFERGWADAQRLTDEIGGWFAEFSQRDLVQLRDAASPQPPPGGADR